MRMHGEATVYFIKPVGLDGPIKIGWSHTTLGRLDTLAAWSPWPLQIATTMVGTYDDEQFLHRCFAASHSHREWFHSTPLLRETIARVKDGATMEDMRRDLTPVGNIRTVNRKPASDEMKRRRSYQSKIMWAEKRLRSLGEDTAWHAPDDVDEIMKRWSGSGYYKIPSVEPSPEQIARLDEYLRDPSRHSVIPQWRRAKVAA